MTVINKALAVETNPWKNLSGDLATYPYQTDPRETTIGVANVIIFLLFIFSIVSFSVLIYNKLRKKNLNDLKSLTMLAGSGLISSIFSYFTLSKLTSLVNSEYALDTSSIIVGNNLLLILTILSLLSLSAFVYYIVVTVKNRLKK